MDIRIGSTTAAGTAIVRTSDRDRCDRRRLALHRDGRWTIARVAAHEGLTAREASESIDRALDLEASQLPDFAWESAAPAGRARWV